MVLAGFLIVCILCVSALWRRHGSEPFGDIVSEMVAGERFDKEQTRQREGELRDEKVSVGQQCVPCQDPSLAAEFQCMNPSRTSCCRPGGVGCQACLLPNCGGDPPGGALVDWSLIASQQPLTQAPAPETQPPQTQAPKTKAPKTKRPKRSKRPKPAEKPQQTDTAVVPGPPASSTDLPPPSKSDDRCVTNMGNSKDTGECFALVYNHCESAYKDQNRIPSNIRAGKSSIIDQMFAIQKKHFDSRPNDWTTVCVARPDKAGKGRCQPVKADEFRVWVKGKGAITDPCLAGGSLYIKAHFDGKNSIQDRYTGAVGHG